MDLGPFGMEVWRLLHWAPKGSAFPVAAAVGRIREAVAEAICEMALRPAM